MLMKYGLIGALAVFYCGVLALWAWAMAQGVQSRLPELVRRRRPLPR